MLATKTMRFSATCSPNSASVVQGQLQGSCTAANENLINGNYGPFVLFVLDFRGTASVCGVMDENERDRISKGFADLTALLEDAAGIAVEGQSGQRSLGSIREHIGQIRPLLSTCLAQLNAIERRIDDQGA